MIDPRAKEYVMVTKLVTGETIISFVTMFDEDNFMLAYPYLIDHNGIGDEYCPMALNRFFAVLTDHTVYMKSVKPEYLESYMALVELDNDDTESFISDLIEFESSGDEDDDMIPAASVVQQQNTVH